MGCIFRLTAILTLATGVHISLASTTLAQVDMAYHTSGIPGAASWETEVFDGYFNDSEKEDGIPGDSGRGGGGRSLRESEGGEDGIPDADGDTGSR